MTSASPSLIDIALEHFAARTEEFKAYEGINLSESDTRSKIIDAILGILGWKEPAITREYFERTDGKYLDYKLATTFPIFVVEAKKNFVRFQIPAGSQKRFRMGGAIKNDPALTEAITQAREYARNSGIQYCCVTNGFQFVFFRASNSHGVPWDKHFATVFRSHIDISNRFSEFYECFSYEAVASGRFSASILVSELPAHESSRFKALADGIHSNHSRDRNVLYPYTRELIKQVFQSLDNEEASPDLLENCYVESSRESSYERGIGELLRDHRTVIPEPTTRVHTQRRNAGEFQSHFEKLAEVGQRFGSLMLILGTVGAGKTSFLNRFRKVFARTLIDSRFVWVSISFNTFTESEDTVSAWVTSMIKTALQENYGQQRPFSWESLQKIYESEIRHLQDGLLKPLYLHDRNAYLLKIAEEVGKLAEREESHYLRCLSFFAKKSDRQIILIFDNADQHSPKLQNEVFLLAQKYSQLLKCIAFISLREESYWKNKELGGLSAFHPTSFQITAPRIEQVLARRFKYASKLILEDKSMVAGHFAVSSLDLNPAKIDKIFRTLHHSLLGDDRRFVRFLEYMAPGEVRRSLDFVARFLTSGHTNINRILDRVEVEELFQNEVIYPVGFHEFLQAVMVGDRTYYSEVFSDVVNLFAVDGKGDQCHFNRLAILARVLRATGESTDFGRGYVSVEEVCHDCETIGMTTETVLTLIGLLTEKRLLATETLARDMVTPSSHVKGTAAAVYYVNELVPMFTYLDLILMDTPIGDDQTRSELAQLSTTISMETDRFVKISTRVHRGRVFTQYLRREYESSTLAKASELFDHGVKNLICRICDAYDDNGEVILASARVAFKR